jgi:hypothetical protein
MLRCTCMQVCTPMHRYLYAFVFACCRFIVRQGRLPVPLQDGVQLCNVFEEAVGTDMHAAQIAAKAAAAAAEQRRIDTMTEEIER